MMERLLEDYQPVVDDLLIATKEFSSMDIVGEKVQIRLAVDDIINKFDAVKKSLLERRTSLDTLCSTAVSYDISYLLFYVIF
jgi:hypothetical protein